MRVWAQALIGFAWALELVLTDPYIHINALKTAHGPLETLNTWARALYVAPKGLGLGPCKRPPGPKEPGPS